MAARAMHMVVPDSIEAGYLLSRYGPARFYEYQDYEGAQEQLNRAVEIAHREGDRILEVRALAYKAQMHYVQGHYRDAIEIFLPVIELAQSLDELDALVNARRNCALSLLAIGDGNEAQIHATAGLEAAERLHKYRLVQRCCVTTPPSPSSKASGRSLKGLTPAPLTSHQETLLPLPMVLCLTSSWAMLRKAMSLSNKSYK